MESDAGTSAARWDLWCIGSDCEFCIDSNQHLQWDLGQVTSMSLGLFPHR